MSARTRLYTVRDRKTGAGRLVRAPSAATAVRIMADALYSVDVASQDECVELATLGVLADPAPEPGNEPPPQTVQEPVTVSQEAWPFPKGKEAA